MAAALVQLSPWRPGQTLYDPMCGTGTLMIEAAMRMANRAPGLTRGFAIEEWKNMPAAARKTGVRSRSVFFAGTPAANMSMRQARKTAIFSIRLYFHAITTVMARRQMNFSAGSILFMQLTSLQQQDFIRVICGKAAVVGGKYQRSIPFTRRAAQGAHKL